MRKIRPRARGAGGIANRPGIIGRAEVVILVRSAGRTVFNDDIVCGAVGVNASCERTNTFSDEVVFNPVIVGKNKDISIAGVDCVVLLAIVPDDEGTGAIVVV